MRLASTITDTVLMVEPVHFGFNPEAANSNSFMASDADLTAAEREQIQTQALREFRGLLTALREAGITVVAVEDTPLPATPDSIFPNNWFSTHSDGTLILYPMEALNRRLERRQDVISMLVQRYHYHCIMDFSPLEQEGIFLEGTGSLIFDRSHRIVYANQSSRMNSKALYDFARRLQMKPVVFTATRQDGSPIYHTNVMMALGEQTAVLCTEAIRNTDERQLVLDTLQQFRAVVIEISFEQMDQFAGNMLQVKNTRGERFWVLSSRAYQGLTPSQISCLQQDSTLIHAPLDTIERYGGGSARCMLAEIFTP